MTDEDVDTVINQATGIKQKVVELQARLQKCVLNLERASNSSTTGSHGNAGATSKHSSSSGQEHPHGSTAVSGPASEQQVAGLLVPVLPGCHGSAGLADDSSNGSGGFTDSDLGEDDQPLPSGPSISFAGPRSGTEPRAAGALPAVTVGAALRGLKQSLSSSVQSSLKGAHVPTHGEELRNQYQRAVGDSIQRRLLGRADKFHSSGGLDSGADSDSQGSLNPSGSLVRSRLGMGSEAGSAPNSPLHPSSPARTSRTSLLAGAASTDLRTLQLNSSSAKARNASKLPGPKNDDGPGSAGSSRRASLDTHRPTPKPLASASPPRSPAHGTRDTPNVAPPRLPSDTSTHSSDHSSAADSARRVTGSVVGFVPPPELISRAAAAAAQPAAMPAVGFTPPPELLTGSQEQQHNNSAAQGAAAGPPRANPRLVLNSFESMPAHGRPAAGMPLRTVETVRLRVEPSVLGFVPPPSLGGPGPSKFGSGPGSAGDSSGDGVAPHGRGGAPLRTLAEDADFDSPDVSSPMLGVRHDSSAGVAATDGGAPAAAVGKATPLVPMAPTGAFSFGISSHVFSSESAAPVRKEATIEEPAPAPAPRGWRIGAASEDDTSAYVVSVAAPPPPPPAEQQVGWAPPQSGTPPSRLTLPMATSATAGADGPPGQAHSPLRQARRSTSSMADSLASPEPSKQPGVPEKLPWEDSSEDEAVNGRFEGGFGADHCNRSAEAAHARVPPSVTDGVVSARAPPHSPPLPESRSLPVSLGALPGGQHAQPGPGRTGPSTEGSLISQADSDFPPAPSFTQFARAPRPSAGGSPGPTLALAAQPSARVPRTSSAKSGSGGSAHDPAVSITITEADLARAGGMVPALLELVRDRFRQKGFHNLAQLAGGGGRTSSGGGVHDGPYGSPALSPSLSAAVSGETLAERIVARVETFQIARRSAMADDLANALMSAGGSEDGGVRAHAEDSRPPFRRNSHLGLLERTASPPQVLHETHPLLPVQRTPSGSRPGVSPLVQPPAATASRLSGSGNSVGGSSSAQGGTPHVARKSASGATPPHSPSPPRPHSTGSATTAASPAAIAVAVPGSARKGAPPAPASPTQATVGATSPPIPPQGTHAPSPVHSSPKGPAPEPSSVSKLEQATQTPPSPQPPAADDPPPPPTQLSTAHAFFLASTVPLTAKSPAHGTHGGTDALDQLLHPDAPVIRTAADFFRGTASRPTINTSVAATPTRELPAGVSPTSAATLAAPAGGSGGGSGDPLGPARGRNARDQLYLSATPGTRSRRQSASGRPSSNGGGGVLVGGRSSSAGRRISAAGGGRVVIDDEPVDLATFSSSRSTPYYPRRPSAGASPAGTSGGIMRAPSGGSDAVPVVGALARGGDGREGDGRGGLSARGLTREVLAHLAHLAPLRHPFETTTDEEREEEERRARRRARQKRVAALGGTSRRSTGFLDEDEPTTAQAAPMQRTQLGGASAQPSRQPSRPQPTVGFASIAPVPWPRSGPAAPSISAAGSPSSDPTRHDGVAAASGNEVRALLPRQLAAVMAETDTLAPGGEPTESPAIAAAPGDEILVPPLSLDAPDMPGTGGDYALVGAGPSSGGGAASAFQLPHETFFISSPRWRPNGPFGEADELAAVAAAAAAIVEGRRVPGGRPDERGVQQVAMAPVASMSRLAHRTTAGTADNCADFLRQRQRSAATVTTWSTSDSDVDADAALTSRGQGARAQHGRSGSAPARGGRRGSQAPAPGADAGMSPARGGNSGRRSGRVPAADGSGGGARRAPFWADEDGLDPFVVADMEQLDLDADALVLPRGGGVATPSSAATSVASQQRYVAAARAHRSVSEANSAKRMSAVLPQSESEHAVGSDSGGGAAGCRRRDRRHAEGEAHKVSSRREVDRERSGGNWRPGDDDGLLDSGDSRRRGAAGDGRPERLAWIPREEDAANDATHAKASSPGTGSDGEDSALADSRSRNKSAAPSTQAHRAQRQAAEAPDSSDAEHTLGAGTSRGALVRESLQRLLDLRTTAVRGQSRDAGSGQSTPPTPSAKQPAQTPPARSPSALSPPGCGLGAAAAAAPELLHRSSRSPSTAATAGGTTHADRTAREELLPGAGSAALAGQLFLQQQGNARRRRSSGSGSDAPPEDPHDLVSPKFTQDMAAEEYGWNAATGDADVDEVASPRRGRRPGRVVAAAAARRGRGAAVAAATLPYDPAEVPTEGVDGASVSYTRELEQQELQDELAAALADVLPATAAAVAAAEAAAAAAATTASPKGLSPVAFSRAAVPQPASGREMRMVSAPGSVVAMVARSLEAVASPEKAPHRRTSGGVRVAPSPSGSGPSVQAPTPVDSSSRSQIDVALSALRSPRSSLPAPQSSTGGGGSPSPRPSASPAEDAAAPASGSIVQPPPQPRSSSSQLLASARSPPCSSARSEALPPPSPAGSPRPATAESLTRASLTSSAFNSALEELLAGRGPASAAVTSAAATQTSISGGAEALLPEPQVRSRQLGDRSGAGAVEPAGQGQPHQGSPRPAASPPDPELRRLLLAAWSRWYLDRAAGAGVGTGPWELDAGREAQAAAAAAEAQARLQALAGAWVRSGARESDSTASSSAVQNAANSSRLHIAFTRWLGQARAARQAPATVSAASQEAARPTLRPVSQGVLAGGAANGTPPHPASPTPAAIAASPSPAPRVPPLAIAAVSAPRPPSPWRTQGTVGSAVAPVVTTWPAALRTVSSPRVQPQPSAAASAQVPASAAAYAVAGPSASPRPAVSPISPLPMPTYGAGPAAATGSGSGALATPTVSRTSGVRQVVGQQGTLQQPPQLTQQLHTGTHVQTQHPWQAGAARPSLAPQAQQQSTILQRQLTPPQRPVVSASPARAAASSAAHGAAHNPSHGLAQPAAATGVAGLSRSMSNGHAAAAAAARPGNLESRIAMQLLDSVGTSEGVVAAGLQVASGGAFVPTRGSPGPSAGGSGVTGRAVAQAIAALQQQVQQSQLASQQRLASRPRPASTGRLGQARLGGFGAEGRDGIGGNGAAAGAPGGVAGVGGGASLLAQSPSHRTAIGPRTGGSNGAAGGPSLSVNAPLHRASVGGTGAHNSTTSRGTGVPSPVRLGSQNGASRAAATNLDLSYYGVRR